jgi:hypothetical protein
MNVEIGSVADQFLFWEYLFRISCIGSLQCTQVNLVLIEQLRASIDLFSIITFKINQWIVYIHNVLLARLSSL